MALHCLHLCCIKAAIALSFLQTILLITIMTYCAMRTTSNFRLWPQRAFASIQRTRTDVILGSPSANCSGVGICRVLAHGAVGSSGVVCPRVKAWLSVTASGKLRFEFEKNSLSEETLRKHFSWMLFQVLEPCVIPYRLLRYRTISQRTIRPGVYQVWDTGTYLVVEF